MPAPIKRQGVYKNWLIPILVLGVTSLALFWGLWTLDQYVTGGPTIAHPTGAIDRIEKSPASAARLARLRLRSARVVRIR